MDQARSEPEPTEDPWAVVGSRSLSQASDHWRDFAAIVASSNIGVAVVAAGFVLTAHQPVGTKLLLGAMLLASAEAFALAYYSIQVGQLSIVGVVRLSDVVAAFGITAAQFAMPAWVAHVARLSRLATPRQLVLPTRHWLLFAAVFALFAAFVSETERRRRHAVLGPRPAWLDAFNRRQRADQLGASATGTLMLAAWALALVLTGSHPIAAVVCLAVALMAIAGAFAWALRAQQSTVEELLRALTT